MAGEIIRRGDTTSHGGTVLEGSVTDICHGKPISYVGHKTHCPKCKGDFPIIEGVLTTTFYGRGVAIAGMKTACGATLIPSQFTDTVEWAGGASFNSGADNGAIASHLAGLAASQTSGPTPDALDATAESSVPDQYDDRYILLGVSDGKPLANTEYAIEREDGSIEHGTTDADGGTHLLKRTADAEHIRVYLGGAT